MLKKVALAAALSSFDEAWSPRIVADVEDFQVKVVKLRGAFDWHHHAREDELFLVVRGRLRMRLRDGDLELGEGELVVIPHGVEHCPEAVGGECHVLLFERASTLNTGTEVTSRTVRDPARL